MKYLCLVYCEEETLNALSADEMNVLVNDSLDYDDALQKAGHLIVAQALEPVQAASTLRVRNGGLAITDGPFAETKEQLLGFILIEAREQDDAIRAASKIPMARLGSIEVRPIKELARP